MNSTMTKSEIKELALMWALETFLSDYEGQESPEDTLDNLSRYTFWQPFEYTDEDALAEMIRDEQYANESRIKFLIEKIGGTVQDEK